MTTEPEAIPADVLEPCPFCGGEAKIIEGEECAYVQCVDVKMHRALWFDGDNNAAGEVAEQWNRRASRAPVDGAGWRPIETAPKDGTHILAKLHRAGCDDMDDRRQPAFTEIREIFYRPYTQFGMDLPWHAGDPMDSHEGLAPDHMGEAVPIAWIPLPAAPGTHPAPASPDADWKKAFAAQSRKLQAVLHLPGVKEALAELTWTDGEPVEVSSPDAEMVKENERLKRALGKAASMVANSTAATSRHELSRRIRELLSKHGGDRSCAR